MKKLIVLLLLIVIIVFGFFAYKSLVASKNDLSKINKENVKGAIDNSINTVTSKANEVKDQAIQDVKNQASDALKNKVDEALGTK